MSTPCARRSPLPACEPDPSVLQAPVGRANPLVLALAQRLFTAAVSIDLTLTGLTGFQLAPD